MRLAYHYEPFNRNVLKLLSEAERDRLLLVADSEFLTYKRSAVEKRDQQITGFWELSQISTPKNQDWYRYGRIRSWDHSLNQVGFSYYSHESSGAGQYVYLIEDDFWDDHHVISTQTPRPPPAPKAMQTDMSNLMTVRSFKMHLSSGSGAWITPTTSIKLTRPTGPGSPLRSLANIWESPKRLQR